MTKYYVETCVYGTMCFDSAKMERRDALKLAKTMTDWFGRKFKNPAVLVDELADEATAHHGDVEIYVFKVNKDGETDTDIKHIIIKEENKMLLTDSQKRFLNSELCLECEDQFDRPWELVENPDSPDEFLWNFLIDGRFVDALTPEFVKEIASN